VNAIAEHLEEYPRHALAAALACGLALACAGDFAVLVVACGFSIACFALRFHVAVAIAACALVIAGAALGALRVASIDADPLGELKPGSEIALGGFLVALPRQGEHGVSMRARVRVSASRWQTIEVRAYQPLAGDSRIGDEIEMRGKLSAVADGATRSPQAASYAKYLIRQGVLRRMQASQVALTGRRRGGIQGVIDSIRTRSEKTLAAGLAPEPAALLRGMVLGGDAGLPEETADDFRAAGLSHILAVSGQNVLLIVILVQAIAVALNLARRWRIIIPAALVCIYVPLCGAQASVLRAGAMGLAGLAALAASRQSSRVYALLLAAIFVFAWNPRATADVGAQLSFAAVLGIMAFTVPLSRRLTRLPGWMAEAFAATCGATIATAPLMAFHFGAVSLVSLAANVLGEPMIGPIVWLGSLSAAIGQISQPLGSLLNAPNGFLIGSLIELAHGAAGVPLAQLAVPKFSSLALVGMSLPIVAAGAWLNDWFSIPPAVGRTFARVRGRPPQTRAIALCVALAAAAFAATTWPRRSLPVRPSIAFLNVGQGDATLLLGSGNCNALIDGGPPDQGLAGKLKRLGVDHLDMVLATHPELDHFGGLAELAAAGEPRVRDFLDGGGAQNVPAFQSVRNGFVREGAASVSAVSGVKWRCADLEVRLYAPDKSKIARPVANSNTIAAVAVVTVGSMRMVASGDAESPELAPLPLPNVDILKVPHHGSADLGLPGILARVDPEISVIEVGADNSYGHPTDQTLQQLGAAGSSVFRTDRDGTVLVSADASGAIEVGRIDD
jgi:competence protein ComEC